MPPPRTSVPALDTLAFAFLARTTDTRNAIAVSNMHAMTRAPNSRQFDFQMRAAAYVWVAAALEEFVTAVLRVLVDEINAAGCARQDLRVSLLSLDQATTFESLRSSGHPRDLKKWPKEIEVLTSVNSTDAAVLSLDEKAWPIDGRTISIEHINAIWMVFGLPTPPVPSPRTLGFLTDLRESRTRVAHGEVDPVSLGRLKTPNDVVAMSKQADDLVVHMHQAATNYVLSRGFVRT